MNTELTNKQIDAAWESAPDRQGYARGRSRYDIAHAVIAADRAARIGEFPALPEPDHATVSPWDKDATQMVFFTADQMRAYAAQAVEADRAARGVPDVKTEIEFIQLITQMLVEINPNNYTDDDVSACVQGTIAALNALAVRENTLLAAAPQPAAQLEPVLTCDFCGCDTLDPWHGSIGTNRHIHACDNCKPKLVPQPAPTQAARKPMTRVQALNLVERVRMRWATSPPTYEMAPAVVRAVEEWHDIEDTP